MSNTPTRRARLAIATLTRQVADRQRAMTAAEGKPGKYAQAAKDLYWSQKQLAYAQRELARLTHREPKTADTRQRDLFEPELF